MVHIDYVELQLEFPRVCMTLLITTPAMYACSTLYADMVTTSVVHYFKRIMHGPQFMYTYICSKK